MSLIRSIFKRRQKKLITASKITYADLFRWQKAPRAPLRPEELMELEVGFKSCDGDCPVAIIYRTLMQHIKWQEEIIKEAKQNYDR